MVILPNTALAAILQLVAQGPLLNGASITVTPTKGNPTFVGLIGDFFEIGDGTYRVTMKSEFQGIPYHTVLEFTVRVMAQKLEILGGNFIEPDCSHGTGGGYKPVVSWSVPTIRSSEKEAQVITLDVTDPKYGIPIDLPNCTAYAYAACTTQKVIVTFNSSPIGADIWIEGELQPYKTNATLSVPYCPGKEREKRILLRAPGAVNCERSISLSPEAKVDITCALEQIH